MAVVIVRFSYKKEFVNAFRQKCKAKGKTQAEIIKKGIAEFINQEENKRV